MPNHLKLANFDRNDWLTVTTDFDDSMTWAEVIPWIRGICNLPLLVKGILTAEDATCPLAAGVDGIIVSNHGARQLDSCPATIDALVEVVDAVKGKIPVLVDGGIRSGTDVVKALAIGASCVLIGRPILYALTLAGEAGVKRVLDIITRETKEAPALSGCCRASDVDRSFLSRAARL